MVLAGSATASLSIQDLIQLSSDKEKTASNLSIDSVKLALAEFNGSQDLREKIAELYDDSIIADNVLVTNGTTGANSLVFQSLLRPNDHVIATYPAYQQLLAIPKATTGVEVSYWWLDLANPAKANVESLKGLIQPNTKMIILNNPNNPLGTILDESIQHEIVALAREHGITVFTDEIFRPLFHGVTPAPSFVEIGKDEDRVVITGSVSKAWGLSGTRIGWLITRNAEIYSQCVDMGLYTIMAVGTLDQKIAAEALSDRCRPAILAKHLESANTNLDILESFVKQRPNSTSWTRPNAGATAFVKFLHNGSPVDDVDFCHKLLDKTGVLLAPGGLTFGLSGSNDLKGYTRVHFTGDTKELVAGLKSIGEFLEEYCQGL